MVRAFVSRLGEIMGEPIRAEFHPHKQPHAGGVMAPARITTPDAGPIPLNDANRRTRPPMDLKTLRVAEYAACQMLLDCLFSVTSTSKRDLESVWIMACVLHNTLRNLVTDPHISARYLNQAEVPDHVYLTMSRRAIADKTGLSRETVRRRTNTLIKDGILIEVNGNVRLDSMNPRNRDDIANINTLHTAAQAFVKAVEDHNAHMPMELPER